MYKKNEYECNIVLSALRMEGLGIIIEVRNYNLEKNVL